MVRRRIRPGVAFLVALCGIAIAAGALVTWVAPSGARPGSGLTHTSVKGLFLWSFRNASPFSHSVGVVVLVLGVLLIIAGVLGLRLLTAVFALLALAVGGAWLALYAHAYSSVGLTYSQLRPGAWLTLLGALVALITAFFVRERR